MSVQLESIDSILPVRVTYRHLEETKIVVVYIDITNDVVWMPGCEDLPERDELAKLVGERCLGRIAVAPAEESLDLSKYNDIRAVTPPKVD